MLRAEQQARALVVVRDIAHRFATPQILEGAKVAAERQSTGRRSGRWTDHGIARGYSGLAVACAALDRAFPDERWDIVGHRFLALAVQGAQRRVGQGEGMFTGLTGVAFAAWQLSRSGSRYRRLVQALDTQILTETASASYRLARQVDNIGWDQFDVISGLAGVGAYLLLRSQPEHRHVLRAALDALVRITDDHPRLTTPLWRTPAHLCRTAGFDGGPLGGSFNCGLAHGIAGPLALLSLAYVEGVRVDGHIEAIGRCVDWLDAHRVDDAWGSGWPAMVPAVPSTAPARASRTAWCYGAPGVARALFLASKALQDERVGAVAIDTLEGVFRRPPAERGIPSPTFCHGVAGLLQITLRFFHDTRSALLGEAVEGLARDLLSCYEPASILGYRSSEAGVAAVDEPGLLDGAPGVALVLMAASTGVEPSWDRLFLLS